MRLTVFVVFPVVLLLSTASAVAADQPLIGYVDLQKVVNESKSGKQARAALEQLVRQKNEQIAREEKTLKDQVAAFEKNQLAMSEAQKNQKRKDLEERFQTFQKSRSEAQRDLAKRENEFLSKAMPALRDIIAAIAQSEKLLLVFDKREMPALYAAEGPDLTGRVLKEFDAGGVK